MSDLAAAYCELMAKVAADCARRRWASDSYLRLLLDDIREISR